MWTDFYILGGRYDVEMQIAPGQGIVSSAVLWSDIQDEIDWEFSGNQHGDKPFPPPDGMWKVETNVFARGKMWDGAATYQKDALKPTTQFHTYSVDWDETHMDWYVDNKVVRSVKAANTPAGFTFPQSPMKLQVGVWGGGDPSNNYWTIQWAGGEIDFKGVPYTMYVKSVNITNKYPACQYRYRDKAGLIGGIDQIKDGCSSSPVPISPSLSTPPRTVGIDKPGVSSVPAKGNLALNPELPDLPPPGDLGGDLVGPSYTISSSSDPPMYPVGSSSTPSSSVTSQLSTTASPSLASLATGDGGYHVIPLSSTGGLLSSLSSLILGTSSGSSTPVTPASLPSALPTPSSVPVQSSAGPESSIPPVSAALSSSTVASSSPILKTPSGGYPVSSLDTASVPTVSSVESSSTAASSSPTLETPSGGYPVSSSIPPASSVYRPPSAPYQNQKRPKACLRASRPLLKSLVAAAAAAAALLAPQR
ncbi:concanavalin A-like lectin/glucanase domain-containing protein [Xylariaceae sp. FL0594]|nr:concanavalin A-like lectin/glucanase domain-containing protein [Xylariaceae sp. FL0594]